MFCPDIDQALFSIVHYYAWPALDAIDSSKHPYLNYIKPPIHATAEK
jgi:hypothetical protein